MNGHSFLLHEIKGYLASIFVAEYKDKILILDGGSRLDAIRIKRFVENTLNRPFSDVKLIISTHPHPDHAGGVQLLRKKFNTPVAAHENFDMWYRGAGGWIQHKIDTFLAHYSARKNRGKNERTWYSRKLKADFSLKNNQLVPFFNDWEIFYIPGHTMYDIAIYHKEKQLLVIGDIVISRKGNYHLPIPVSFKDKMKGSLLKLNKLEVKTILMAHGGIVENPDKDFFRKIADKVEFADKRISKSVKLLCSFAPDVRVNRKIQKKSNSNLTDNEGM